MPEQQFLSENSFEMDSQSSPRSCGPVSPAAESSASECGHSSAGLSPCDFYAPNSASPGACSDITAPEGAQFNFARTLLSLESPRVLDETEAKVFRRKRAAQRERRRLKQHRDAFEALQSILPGDTKRLSRVDILQQAAYYIEDLAETLKNVEREEEMRVNNTAHGPSLCLWAGAADGMASFGAQPTFQPHPTQTTTLPPSFSACLPPTANDEYFCQPVPSESQPAVEATLGEWPWLSEPFTNLSDMVSKYLQ